MSGPDERSSKAGALPVVWMIFNAGGQGPSSLTPAHFLWGEASAARSGSSFWTFARYAAAGANSRVG